MADISVAQYANCWLISTLSASPAAKRRIDAFQSMHHSRAKPLRPFIEWMYFRPCQRCSKTVALAPL